MSHNKKHSVNQSLDNAKGRTFNNISKGDKSRNDLRTDKAKIKNLRLVILASIMILMFYSPLVQGLYFETTQLFAEVFVLCIFTVYWIYKGLNRDRVLLKTPIEYIVFGFAVLYFISIFFSIDKRLAVAEWLKYCMYFAVFIMVSDLMINIKNKMAILWTIMISGLLVCVLGLDAAVGGSISSLLNNCFAGLGIDFKFFDLFVGGRVTSTFQYPNTLAAYLLCVIFISYGLTSYNEKVWQKIVSSIFCFILVATFILTSSEGAFLIMPLAMLLFIIIIPSNKKLVVAVYSFVPTIAAVFFALLLKNKVIATNSHALKLWFFIFAGLLVTAMFVLFVALIEKHLEKINWKIVYGSAAVVLIGVTVVSLFSAVPLRLEHKASDPETQVSLIKNVSLKPDKNYSLVFLADADMQQDKPNAYSIDIYSKTDIDILLGKSTTIATYAGLKTEGMVEKSIDFKTPSETKVIDIVFANTYQNTGVTFNNAKIVDAATGKVVKRLILNHRFIPISLISRIEGLYVDLNTVSRAQFYIDALNIFKDNWFIGSGAGTWKLLYNSYQSYSYISKETHSYVVQLALECGIIGLLLLGALIVFILLSVFVWKWVKNIKNNNENVLHAAILAALAAMLLHACIDFDFSLSAIFLLFWVLLALFNTQFRRVDYGKEVSTGKKGIYGMICRLFNIRETQLPPKFGVAVSICLAILPFMLLLGIYSSRAYIKAFTSNDIINASRYADNAVAFDPLMAEYKIDSVKIMSKKQGSTQEDAKRATKLVEQAEKLSKYRPDLAIEIAKLYFSSGNIEKGIENIDRAAKLMPYDPKFWESKADAYMQVALHYSRISDAENTMKYLDKVLNILEEVKAINKKYYTPFLLTDKTYEIIEKVVYVKDSLSNQNQVDISKLVFYSIADLDINVDNKPDQWSINDRSGQVIFKDGIVFAENYTEKNIYLFSRSLSLQKDKTYSIEVELENNADIASIPYKISNVSSELGELLFDGNKFIGALSTPADFVSGNNYLCISVKGKYEIKSVVIKESN